MEALIEALRGASDAAVQEDVPAEFDSDFGRLVERRARVLVRATCEEHVVQTLRTVRGFGVPLTVRGAGHSCFGQTLTDGVILVNQPDRAEGPRLIGEELVDVPARMRWREVESFLNGHGRSVPVLADYLDLSVGGTLAVGCYGADSVTWGPQVDAVESLRLITPDGVGRRCSPSENAELFSYALAGLGQVGVMETARLRTVPYRPFATLFTRHHGNLADLVDSLRWLVDAGPDRPLLFKALHGRGRYVSTYGVQSETLRDAFAAVRRPPPVGGPIERAWVMPRYRQWRSLVVRLWVAQFKRHGRLWSDFLFDYEGLRAFAAFLEPILAKDAMARCLKSLYILGVRKYPRAVALPLESTDHLNAPMAFGIGLYSMIPAGGAGLTNAVADVMAECLEECARLGGRPYRYGWHRLTPAHHRAFYDCDYDRLQALRCELDPDGLFQRSVS